MHRGPNGRTRNKTTGAFKLSVYDIWQRLTEYAYKRNAKRKRSTSRGGREISETFDAYKRRLQNESRVSYNLGLQKNQLSNHDAVLKTVRNARHDKQKSKPKKIKRDVRRAVVALYKAPISRSAKLPRLTRRERSGKVKV